MTIGHSSPMVRKAIHTIGCEIIMTVVFAFEIEFQLLNFGSRNFLPNAKSVGMEVDFMVVFIGNHGAEKDCNYYL